MDNNGSSSTAANTNTNARMSLKCASPTPKHRAKPGHHTQQHYQRTTHRNNISRAPSTNRSRAQPKAPLENFPIRSFDNPLRMRALMDVVSKGASLEELKTDLVRIMLGTGDENESIIKNLHRGRTTSLGDGVKCVQFQDGSVVVKCIGLAQDGFPGCFQELVSNIVCTDQVNTNRCWNYVKMLDALVANQSLFMIYEKVEGDLRIVGNLDQPNVLWDILFQVSVSVMKMQEMNKIVHFDLRHDNVLIQSLDEPVVLFPDVFDYQSNFICKLSDFGQAELDLVGVGRPANKDIYRDRGDRPLWGHFPKTFCSGYDLQYFIYTLPSIQRTLSTSRLFKDVMAFINVNSSNTLGRSNLTKQSRPIVVSDRPACATVQFLKDWASTFVPS